MLGRIRSLLGGGRTRPTGSSVAQVPRIVFDDSGDKKLLFELPAPGSANLPSVAVFAMPKAGSVMLDRIMRDLSAHVGLTYVSIMEEFFRIGLPDANMPMETSEIFVETGYCYGGFRYFPRRFEIPILDTARPVLLVRDPRDMLVSHYYSMRESHPEPGRTLSSVSSKMSMRDWARELEIDDYTHKASETFRRFLTNYRTILCAKYDTKVYRYEDIIYAKTDWVSDLAEHFGWDLPGDLAADIAKKQEIIPKKEAPNQHVRQVHPGNFKSKLRPDTLTRRSVR